MFLSECDKKAGGLFESGQISQLRRLKLMSPDRPSLRQACSQRRKKNSGLTASGYSADRAELMTHCPSLKRVTEITDRLASHLAGCA